MHEVTFHKELAEMFRAQGAWIAKWPDSPVSAMRVGQTGRLRFALPKPFDLVGFLSDGRGLAVECKLVQGPTFRVNDRAAVQLATLRDIQKRNGYAALALNFRFARKRTGRVNRAFLVTELEASLWAEGTTWALGVPWPELIRISGGWKLPEGDASAP